MYVYLFHHIGIQSVDVTLSLGTMKTVFGVLMLVFIINNSLAFPGLSVSVGTGKSGGLLCGLTFGIICPWDKPADKQCSTIGTEHGTIKYPVDGGLYKSSASEEFYIVAKSCAKLIITFTHFDLDASLGGGSTAYVHIHDAPDTDSNYLVKLLGNSKDGYKMLNQEDELVSWDPDHISFITSKNVATLDFYSYKAKPLTGFTLVWSCFDDYQTRGTEQKPEPEHGTIKYPENGGLYENNAEKEFHIAAKTCAKLSIRFSHFDLDAANRGTPNDGVYIYDGPNDDARFITVLCGNSKDGYAKFVDMGDSVAWNPAADSFTTSTNVAAIYFYSNSKIQKTGFTLEWSCFD